MPSSYIKILPEYLAAAPCEPAPDLTATADFYVCSTCLTLLETIRATHPKSWASCC